MKHSIVFRGAQPVASVEADDPLHDEKILRAVNDAHSLNQREGASAEIIVKDQDDDGKIVAAQAAPQKKGN